uniref:Uncharacterized protein LOC117308092 n=1 Tax=Tursiops truncatus TaxID=9739 RepID=A0A6J3Q0A2_TURTR|nr:uncharacterized protein LOC117308092 [Tursiops truncatus]XP_033695729.1 uncharacterized protein LOC117308092 [Tursiops truncatus]XP_033695730.1 uncharacterized protein LOC117308092 [Tursiops truncatus]
MIPGSGLDKGPKEAGCKGLGRRSMQRESSPSPSSRGRGNMMGRADPHCCGGGPDTAPAWRVDARPAVRGPTALGCRCLGLSGGGRQPARVPVLQMEVERCGGAGVSAMVFIFCILRRFDVSGALLARKKVPLAPGLAGLRGNRYSRERAYRTEPANTEPTPPLSGSHAPRAIFPCPQSPRPRKQTAGDPLQPRACPNSSIHPTISQCTADPASPFPSPENCNKGSGPCCPQVPSASGLTRCCPVWPCMACPLLWGTVSDELFFQGSGLHVCHLTYLIRIHHGCKPQHGRGGLGPRGRCKFRHRLSGWPVTELLRWDRIARSLLRLSGGPP